MSTGSRRIHRRISRNCYRYDANLKSYLEKKLVFERTRRAGTKLSNEDDQRRSLDTEKVKILNTHIFPSMANLVTFLEYSQKDELREVFADDIKELFFGKSSSQDGNTHPAFLRFLLASAGWKPEMIEKNKTDSERIQNPTPLDQTVKLTDFRLKLLDYIYKAIGSVAIFNGPKFVYDDDAYANVVKEDFVRLGMYIKLLTKNADTEDFDPANVRRPVLF
jgi:hypothetical protein